MKLCSALVEILVAWLLYFSDKILRRAQEIAGKDVVDVPGAHSDHRPRPTHPALLTQRASTFHSKAEQVITV